MQMSWPRLKPLYTKIYQDAFTQEEIDGLIAFYRSPAGMAYVDKMPLVTQKSMDLMQSLMPPMMKRVQAAMAKAVGDGK